ncbi:MAG: insulinase family protein [Acidobacteria bacterium]|nr:insulinase family protein [Acidobacteriota bacterium]
MKKLFIVVFIALLSMSTGVPAQAANGELKLPPYKKVKLGNGMTVLLMEQHEVPIISFNFIVKAGSVADPVGKEGLASVTAELLRKGTKTRSAEQLAAALDFIGGEFAARAGYDFTNGFAEFVKKDVNTGVTLMADALLEATFPQGEITKLIKQRVDGIKAAKDQAQGVIGTYFAGYFYGKHPYGRPVGGDENTLAAITRADVVQFYQSWYAPANMTLAIAGDFQAAEMEKLITDTFGAWKVKGNTPITIADAAPFQGKKLLLVDKPDSTQTFFMIGNLGIARNNPDRVLINVVNTLFGGRFTSMLNSELRIQTGLTYGARSTFDERKARGPFIISTYTRNEKTEEALDRTLNILQRLHEKGISEAELKSAKAYIKGTFPTSLETTDQLAATLAQLDFYGLDDSDVNSLYAKLDAMTLADATRIIKEYFPLDNLVFVLVGKASEIEKMAKKYAPVFEKKAITQTGF